MSTVENQANILIVDDKPANLDVLSEMLRQCGHKVRPATSGKLALQAAEKQPPDLILLDILMPGMDGFQVCRQLKNHQTLKKIPVIFISALTQAFDKVKAFKYGGVDYISKPFHVEEVVARVETHLKVTRYQMEMELKNKQLERALDELKNAQTRVVQCEKMACLGVLTAGIAHEINNPVNFITSGIVALRRLVDDLMGVMERYAGLDAGNADQALKEIDRFKDEIAFDEIENGLCELIDNMETGAKRTMEIVRGLRTFARLDENDEKTVDIHQNIESTLMLLRNEYRDVISIRKDFGNLPPIPCFPGKLNQVFMNVLSNAVDAIKSKENPSPDEEICVRTGLVKKNKDRFVEIEIRDTGKGIPDEVRDHIFEPFYTTKEVGKGNGLGLSISLGIVESHGGTIEVDSNRPNGTVFRIYLPLKSERKGDAAEGIEQTSDSLRG